MYYINLKEKTFIGRNFISEVKRSWSTSFSSEKIAMAQTFHCISFPTLLISSSLNRYFLCFCLCPIFFFQN